LRIGIVSDTHLRSGDVTLPAPLVRGLEGVDRIIHAGDWTHPDVIPLFERIAPVDSVAGNNDGPDIVRRFGRIALLELGGRRIGLIHGDGPYASTEERAWRAFQHNDVDIIVFGHSHVPYMEERQGVVLFNPGSPTDKRFQKRYSYGILEIRDGTFRLEHRFFDKKD
jgi:putative phosphoesterase